MGKKEEKAKARELARRVVDVVLDAAVHHRDSWSLLAQHQRSYEGWWKAIIALSLEGWCWRRDLGVNNNFWLRTEVNPSEASGVTTGATGRVDLVVGRFSEQTKDLNLSSGPRVWIELKERGTWFGNGNAKKAFGVANHGLEHDLAKWEHATWTHEDVVLACQIVTHRGPWESPMPESWRTKLDAIENHTHFLVGSRAVSCPVPGNSYVHTTIEFLNIWNAPDAVESTEW